MGGQVQEIHECHLDSYHVDGKMSCKWLNCKEEYRGITTLEVITERRHLRTRGGPSPAAVAVAVAAVRYRDRTQSRTNVASIDFPCDKRSETPYIPESVTFSSQRCERQASTSMKEDRTVVGVYAYVYTRVCYAWSFPKPERLSWSGFSLDRRCCYLLVGSDGP